MVLPFHLNELKSSSTGMLCVKFGWNWHIGYREEEFLIFFIQ